MVIIGRRDHHNSILDFVDRINWLFSGGISGEKDTVHYRRGDSATKFINDTGATQQASNASPGDGFPMDLSDASQFLRIWRRINHALGGTDDWKLEFIFSTNAAPLAQFIYVLEDQLAGAPHYKTGNDRYFKMSRDNPDSIVGSPDWSTVISVAVRMSGKPAGKKFSVTMDDLSDNTPISQAISRAYGEN